MTNWPEYVSHKVVRAAKIVAIEQRAVKIIYVRPAGEEFDNGQIEEFKPTVPGMAHKAEVGDWAMLYPDGYKSISPERAFAEGYMPLALMPQEPKTLEGAIEHAINKFSAESGSNTPDFILAQFLMGALAAWDAAVKRREEWYGRPIGGLIDLGVQQGELHHEVVHRNAEDLGDATARVDD